MASLGDLLSSAGQVVRVLPEGQGAGAEMNFGLADLGDWSSEVVPSRLA
jgi:hypothetical protein